MNILLLPDRENWAYDAIAKALIKHNDDSSIAISSIGIKGNVDKIKRAYKNYDAFLVMGFQTWDKVDFLPKTSTMIGVHSFHSWDDRKTMPGEYPEPPAKLVDFLNQFARVNVVSSALQNAFGSAGVSNLWHTSNGVDTSIFKPSGRKPGRGKNMVVGYSGSSAHDWRKGVSEFIVPAAKKAGVRTKLAQLSRGSYVEQSDMPEFYKHLDAYVCASSSEGFSLSVLEAGASGLPIITTRCSGCEELINDGSNGFFVERDVKSIADKIRLLSTDDDAYNHISERIREDIVNKHCWSIKVHRWVDFLRGIR